VPHASSRIKLVLFHAIMWTIVALPLLAAAVLLSVSIIAYDILRHPERHQNTRRIWNVIASDLYFEYEANLWQNQKDCVQYDDKLLYKPSSGCRFANKEFSTDLTFSEEGRVTIPSRATASRRPLIFAGDSETMGWGVNDGETFASLIAASIEAPVLNLGVASYGTVREILRVRMQPRFQDASCIVIQYSWNDFDENSVFLARGALPSPTRKRFQQLLSDYGKRDVSFRDVLIRTFELMLNYPLAFFLNVIGWHDFPLEDDDPMNMNGTPREETEDTKAFLAVLASFPELNGKKIFVMGPGRFISALSRETAPANVFPIPVDLNDGDWYTLDMHPNKEGHRQMAAQILQQLKRTEEGRQCLAGEP
jgi:lysophospholipase L1-like esterase